MFPLLPNVSRILLQVSRAEGRVVKLSAAALRSLTCAPLILRSRRPSQKSRPSTQVSLYSIQFDSIRFNLVQWVFTGRCAVLSSPLVKNHKSEVSAERFVRRRSYVTCARGLCAPHSTSERRRLRLHDYCTLHERCHCIARPPLCEWNVLIVHVLHQRRRAVRVGVRVHILVRVQIRVPPQVDHVNKRSR